MECNKYHNHVNVRICAYSTYIATYVATYVDTTKCHCISAPMIVHLIKVHHSC